MTHKTLHYCWFGKNPLPELVQKCIESWKKFCPDYEIKEWNEDNFDVHCCRYVEEAYNAQKWAFVSDYCRFFVLYNEGGVYLDTDVELLKPLDDLPDTFVGFENPDTVASGLIRAACKGDEICKRMLDSYNADVFLLEDGSLNLQTVGIRETAIFKELGLQLDDTLQTVGGTTVYPREYFCPKSFIGEEITLTDNTYSIHHYSASWHTPEEEYAHKLKKKFRKLPKKTAGRLANFFAMCKYRGFFKAVKRTFGKMKKK